MLSPSTRSFDTACRCHSSQSERFPEYAHRSGSFSLGRFSAAVGIRVAGVAVCVAGVAGASSLEWALARNSWSSRVNLRTISCSVRSPCWSVKSCSSFISCSILWLAILVSSVKVPKRNGDVLFVFFSFVFVAVV